MLKIGCHLSVSKGYYKAGLEALSIGANTFQFFTRNPRGGKAKDIDIEDVRKLKELMVENNFAPLFAHASYTMNLCSDKEETREFAKTILKDDLERLKLLPKSYYIFHPGSHVKQGVDVGIGYIIEALNEVIDETNETKILLEGMSGKGTEIGRSFEEIRAIIDGVKHNEHLGIMLDTCHLYSAGYDIVNDLDGVIDELDRVIGLDRVYGVHINDSKMPYASNKDRHETIGEGTIGLKALEEFINHPKLRDLIYNLETPNEVSGHGEEIEMLRGVYVAFGND